MSDYYCNISRYSLIPIKQPQNLAVDILMSVRQFKFILEAHLLFSNVEPSMQINNPFAVRWHGFSLLSFFYIGWFQ